LKRVSRHVSKNSATTLEIPIKVLIKMPQECPYIFVKDKGETATRNYSLQNKGFEKDKGNLAFSCENKTQTGNEINLAPETRNEFSQDLLR